jgi:hypothetical protein
MRFTLNFKKNIMLFTIIHIYLISFSLIYSQSRAKSDVDKYNNAIIPDIDIKNFDVRERFYDCYNSGYDADPIVYLII